MMRIVFLGNAPGYSQRFVETLLERSSTSCEGLNLVAIICPQRHTFRHFSKHFAWFIRILSAIEGIFGQSAIRRIFGRRGEIYLAMQRLAESGNFPVFFPESLEHIIEEINGLKPDICIVAGLNRILKADMINRLPPIFNIHPSLLPAYCGGAPEFWQLADGAETGGITLHLIDPGIDTGPIIMQRSFDLPPWFDVDQLGELTIAAGQKLLEDFLDGYPDTAISRMGRCVENIYRSFPTPSDRIAPLHVDAWVLAWFAALPFLDRIAPFHADAWVVFNRSRAFGWSVPLIVYVEPAAWQMGEALAVLVSTPKMQALQLYEPVPFAKDTGYPAGTVRSTPRGGAVLACSSGTVLFHRACLLCGS